MYSNFIIFVYYYLKKKYLAMKQTMLKTVLLFVVMSVSLTATAQSGLRNEADFVVDGKRYQIISDKDCTVKLVEGNPGYSGDIQIPETVQHKDRTYTVTALSCIAFYYCNKLTSVVMPNSITTVYHEFTTYGDEYGVFEGCGSLQKVVLSKNLAEIDSDMFHGCSSLSEIDLSNVTSISRYAFKGCTSLTSIYLPKATSISSAFEGCTSLTSVDLPQATVIGLNDRLATEIGLGAFAGCTSLTSVDLPQVTTIDKAFEGCTSLRSVDVPQATTIGEFAFEGCTSLMSINMPQVTEIGYYAFQGCTSLKCIELPYGLTSLSNNLFYDCVSLSEVVIPRNVTTIGDECFYMCNALKEIYLPYNVAEIGESAFYSYGLKTVSCENPIPPTCYNSSFMGGYGTVLNVPKGSAAAYRASIGWSAFATINEVEFSGVEDVIADGGVEVKVVGGRIMLDGVAEGCSVAVYNLSGQQVYCGTGSREIPIGEKGAYVVRIANKTLKVIL